MTPTSGTLTTWAATATRDDLIAELVRMERERDALADIVGPKKAGALASLVRHATKLVQIERDDARAEIARMRPVVEAAERSWVNRTELNAVVEQLDNLGPGDPGWSALADRWDALRTESLELAEAFGAVLTTYRAQPEESHE